MEDNFDITRIFQLFIIQPIIGLFFIYLVYRILKKDKGRLNTTFSLFYIFIALSVILNMVYALVFNILIVTILNFITNFCVSFALIFLYTSNQIILESSMIYTKREELKDIARYGVFLLLTIIFYFIFDNQGVRINETTNWRPNWQLPYFIYVIIVVTFGAVIPTIKSSIEIYNDFKDETLKKRWKYFLIGLLGLFTYMYLAFFNNLLNSPIFRTFFSLFALSVVLWVYLIYFGIGRQIK